MDDILKLFGVIMASGGAGILLYGMYAAVSRLSGGVPPLPPLEGRAGQERIEALEDRVEELLPLQQRVLELEERLDFAERVLGQSDAARLEAGRES